MAKINYISVAENLVKKAKNKGANLRIHISNDKSFDVGIRNGEVEELQESAQTSLSMSVNLDNKTASAAPICLHPFFEPRPSLR